MEWGLYRRGLWARGLVEISDNPAVLDDGNFWAVLITYEGTCTFARFREVTRVAENEFIDHFHQETWEPIVEEWKSSLSKVDYIDGVKAVRQSIARGDVYQINLCRILSVPAQGRRLKNLYPRISVGNPAPYLTSMELPEISIVSASPELLLRRDGQTIISSPIKGTAKSENQFLEKDRAENVMIVDLVRHDFGSICESGTVTIPRLMGMEAHPGLFHLVSDVQGQLQQGISWSEILSALLPAGSISGAPKSSAIKLIASLEKRARGPYCGAIGWVHGDQGELAVGIRTFWKDFEREEICFGTGAGITWGSEPELEWEETELKAHRLLSILR